MDVAGLQADPVHRRQVTDRVADLGVLDQLRLTRRTGGEVEQQRVVGGGVHLGHGTVVRRASRRSASQPSTGAPTATRMQWSAIPAYRPASALLVTTARTPPRVIRSARSASVSSVVAGIITAPARMQPSMISHSGTVLPSTISTRSPGCSPASVSQPATWRERSAISAYVSELTSPSSSTMVSAATSGCSTASASNQSRAQLNRSNARPVEVPVRRLVVLPVRDQEVPRLPELPGDVRRALFRQPCPAHYPPQSRGPDRRHDERRQDQAAPQERPPGDVDAGGVAAVPPQQGGQRAPEGEQAAAVHADQQRHHPVRARRRPPAPSPGTPGGCRPGSRRVPRSRSAAARTWPPAIRRQ